MLAVFCAAIAVLVFSAAWPDPKIAVVGALFAAGFYLLLAAFMTISVCDHGLSIFGTSFLPWVDIAAARRREFFGLQYLIVARRRGWPLWIPLYFRANVQLEEELLRHAPEDNPIRSALSPDPR